MRPEDLSLVLRPRSGMEALDLGFALARRAGASLFLPVAVVVAAATLISAAILASADDLAGIADFEWVLVWWLKPVYDRLALHVLAREVFGVRLTPRQSLQALPGLLRGTGLPAGLTWRRFSPRRSLLLPVLQLEGQRGAAARARRRQVGMRTGGAATALLLTCALFEACVMFGLIGLAVMLLPQSTGLDRSLFEVLFSEDVPSLAVTLSLLGMYALAVCVIEPFFVAAGFCLYLKRRTDLEAWDVELQLRRVAAQRPALASALAALGIASVLAFLPPDASAQQGGRDREVAARQAAARIRQVLEHPDFGEEKQVGRLTFKKKAETRDHEFGAAPGWLEDLGRFWVGAMRWAADGLRVAGWAALALLGLILSRLLLRELQGLRLRRSRRPPPPAIAGLDIRPESLPDDVGAAARALFAQGKAREALALLYRGALSRLAHGEGIEFCAGDTEGDCLARVTRGRSPARAAFATLTLAWQRAAYAAQEIGAGEAESLCAAWSSAFGGTKS